MEAMPTVLEVIKELKDQGYTVDFNIKGDLLHMSGNDLVIHPDEFVVDKHYRFEGESDPDDEAVIYAISSPVHQVKGILLNAYGIYSDPLTDVMVAKLRAKAQK